MMIFGVCSMQISAFPALPSRRRKGNCHARNDLLVNAWKCKDIDGTGLVRKVSKLKVSIAPQHFPHAAIGIWSIAGPLCRGWFQRNNIGGPVSPVSPVRPLPNMIGSKQRLRGMDQRHFEVESVDYVADSLALLHPMPKRPCREAAETACGLTGNFEAPT